MRSRWRVSSNHRRTGKHHGGQRRNQRRRQCQQPGRSVAHAPRGGPAARWCQRRARAAAHRSREALPRLPHRWPRGDPAVRRGRLPGPVPHRSPPRSGSDDRRWAVLRHRPAPGGRLEQLRCDVVGARCVHRRRSGRPAARQRTARGVRPHRGGSRVSGSPARIGPVSSGCQPG